MDIRQKCNWSIQYCRFEGLQRRAVELCHRELGSRVLREGTEYVMPTLAVLPYPAERTGSTVVIGLREECALIAAHIAPEEIPPRGYAVRVMDDPEREGGQLVLITGETDRELFYGATDFVFDFIPASAPRRSSVRNTHDTFHRPLPAYFHASAPAVATRGIWAWGHPINDYRDYIEKMAYMRLNQLILWNDFMPINADDVIAYAHSFGIEVIWGYAWGWTTNCGDIDLDALDALSARIAAQFEREYAPHGVDGIYFQSFTELHAPMLRGRLIADVVTDFVNATAARIFEKHPQLKLQFGLHATSVRDYVANIARTDPRIEILWEDCGPAPYAYYHAPQDDAAFAENVRVTDEMIDLRRAAGGRSGFAFKGHAVFDWTRFVHQSGPYILGEASRELIEHDRALLRPIWRVVQADWLQYGEQTWRMVRHMVDKTGGEITLCAVGDVFGGFAPYSLALTAEMLWDCRSDYSALCARVARKGFVELV